MAYLCTPIWGVGTSALNATAHKDGGKDLAGRRQHFIKSACGWWWLAEREESDALQRDEFPTRRQIKLWAPNKWLQATR